MKQAYDVDAGVPFHPPFFEIFKIISRKRFGKVDVEDLWYLREVCLSLCGPASGKWHAYTLGL